MEPTVTNKTSEQNITRHIEITNKLTVTRGKRGGDNRGKKEKGCQETSIKDTWTKPKRGRIEGGRWGWMGQGRLMGGKMETTVLEQQLKNKIKSRENM